ncbi:MAG: hypothetical protein NWE76_05655 [Candidatus Bathyarchaeota archaeon]|nr:hypothetical protein [Candidatus Bathyarchaeota archaeon]
MKYPFQHTLSGPESGRGYYGPSLQDPRDQPPIWSTRDQEDFYARTHSPWRPFIAAAGLGAAFGSGFIPFKGKRLGDYYGSILRGLEDISPGQIGRTFQVSTLFSQFETPPVLKFTAKQLQQNMGHARYLEALIGTPEASARILGEGVKFEGGKLYYGGGDVALKHAGVLKSSIGASSRIGQGIAHTVGLPPKSVEGFASFISKPGGINVQDDLAYQIIGAQTRRGYVGRQIGAIATESVGRFNRLLAAPFDLPGVRQATAGLDTLLDKTLGQKFSLAVAEGSAGKMFGRLALRYGLMVPTVAMGYQTADWLTETSSIFDNTFLDEGLTVAGASLLTGANTMMSNIAKYTGGHAYREAQEDIAPGSTTLKKLAAFPLMGALGGLGVAYAGALHGTVQHWRGGEAFGKAAYLAREEAATFGGKDFVSRMGQFFATSEGTIGKNIRKIATKTADDTNLLKVKFLGKLGPRKLLATMGAAVGGAMILPFLPGALVPSTRPEELQQLYSGEKEIAVRKGRWWEFGRSPYEGSRIAYFRPHWYARMRGNARERAIWGDEYDKLSPLERWYKQEFTYELERKHYKERPYPITGLPFEDVPLIGPLLAGTVGRLIKPARLMHTEEWMSDKGTLAQPPRFGERTATEIGQEAPGKPRSPYDASGIAGEQMYRLTEMAGLWGFTASSVKEALTGSADWFDQQGRLETSRAMYGFERKYWDLELGGMLGTTEAFRRLYPHRRRQIPQYNPIRNLMPNWLPGEGTRSPDFLHGDPYTKVPEGELRLPGRGYEQRYPELKGVNPEDYPLIHRFKILADVAPYTDKFKEHLGKVRGARKGENWTEREEMVYKQTMEQIKERKQKREFHNYQYLNRMGGLGGDEYYAGDDNKELIGAINRQIAARKEGDKGGIFSRLFGGYWELLSHNAETALDQMTPVSPGAKLVHMRTAIESYERQQVYGTENAFWQRPVRDFIRPAFWMTANSFGYDKIPGHIQQRRNLEQYFDVLKYVKYTRLSNIARTNADKKATAIFEKLKDQTMFGLNPYTHNFISVFRALPRRDRDYFNEFAAAETEDERAKILQMVPENEKALYVARWKMGFADEVRRAINNGDLAEDELDQAEGVLADIREESRREGFPANKELMAEYMATRLPGESYGDWYRRTKLLEQLPSLPGPDWVGWHPSVDLDDIKLKTVMEMGEDMHDYDLWPSRFQKLSQKPYIDEDAIAPILEPERLTEGEIRDRINELFLTQRIRPYVSSESTWGVEDDEIELEMEVEPSLDRVFGRFGTN